MQFADQLLKWHKNHGRHDLPWQGTSDPFHIWASEIMLQQTQVITVIPYYLTFVDRFPTVSELAKASLDDFLSFWSGLGYYQRARNMHRCAQTILIKHQGNFPNEYEQLLTLPGIGPSTAAAIMSQAYEQPYAILDGNVKRVLSRLHSVKLCIDQSEGIKHLWSLANHHMPQKNCRTYTQAIMDLGATVCQKKPLCQHCPMTEICISHQQNSQTTLPVRKKKQPAISMPMAFHVYRNQQGEYGLVQRTHEGIWQDLICFPPSASNGKHTITQTHLLTHRKLEISYEIQDTEPESVTHWLTKHQLLQSAIPNALRKMIDEIDDAFNIRGHS
jgi:A/G-specific adenine glycosylase